MAPSWYNDTERGLTMVFLLGFLFSLWLCLSFVLVMIHGSARLALDITGFHWDE